MKKIFIFWMLCCALIACKRNSVSFTYSPVDPRAGETVTFTNNTTTGQDWSWSFGDGASTAVKSPAHVFRRPGTYLVVLKVDNNNGWVASQEITVHDTVPTFTASDSVFVIYKDYTFTANVYNPYSYDVVYEWTTTDSVISVDEGTLKCYFTRPDQMTSISLRVMLNEDTTNIVKVFNVEDRKTNSLLFRTQENDYRQRIFGNRAEGLWPVTASDTAAAYLLEHETDTMQNYNGNDFRLSELQTVFPEMQGFHIASRKIYYRANGLWVANIDGAYQVQIDAAPCAAMTLDTKDNRIYWANEQGVWYMPFVGSDNNRFVTVPTRLNELKNVIKIAADSKLR